jgi:protein SCO1/2
MESLTDKLGTRRMLLLGAGAAAAGWLAANASRDESETSVASARRISRVPGDIPNPIVQTHGGRKVRFYDDLVRDKVVAINMTYVGCEGICPAVTGSLLRVQRMLGERAGRDVFMYSITLTPEVDTPRALNAYAKSIGVGPGWSFLTGDPDDIENLRLGLGFFDPIPAVDADRTQHAGTLRIGNAKYDRWAMSPGQAAPEQILTTINHVSRMRAVA